MTRPARFRPAPRVLLLAPSLVLAILCLAPRADAEISDGLVAYWSLDTNLEDSVGGYDGTMEGNDLTETYAPGKFGSGIDLDGAAFQRVVIGGDENDLDFAGGSVSVSAWFTVEAFTKSWQALVAKGEGNGWRVARRGTSNIMAYAGGTGDIPTDDTTGPNVNNGQFHHVVAISEGGVSTRLWVDGQLVATGGAPNLEDRANPMMIGGNPDDAGGNHRTWNGVIDDVALWNRPLDEDEIGALWNGGNGNPVGALLNPDDTDGDGMPNFWEQAEGTNPNVADDQEDPDSDGLKNIDEFNRGTRPNVADTDGDTLLDGVETGTGTFVNAGDTGTDPLKKDSDGDGLQDNVEDGGGTLVDENQTGTDPNIADTDGDTFTDYAEIVFGTDPNDIMSIIPGLPGLPFVEMFDDPILNPAIWRTDLNIPQGGASVSVMDGHAVLQQRGHLVTVDQFDPETTSGILISGEWTFATTGDVDFVQILTRSDGVPDPANCCGETQSGIEFRYSTDQTLPTIGVRGFDLVVTPGTTSGGLTVAQGMTVEFEIIDDGEGGLAFRMTQKGNPANTARVTATLDSDVSTTDHIVFHNREGGGRVAHLDNVLITNLDDSDGDGMPDTWEIANMLDPNDAADAAQGANDGLFDNDGLTNLEEFLRGSNPNKADSDDDGLNDIVETGTGNWISPSDTGTSPSSPDTDADGLVDGVETRTGTFVSAEDTGSDPHVADTDADTFDDGTEVLEFGTNPNDPNSFPDISTGLVGYWPLDGTVEDAVGENDGIPIGGDPSFVPGQFGQALSLPGGQYIQLGPPENESQFDFVGGSMTVSAWFTVGAFNSSWQCLVAKGEGNSWRVHRRGDTTEMSFTGGNGDTPENFIPVDDGEIHHVVGVTRAGDVEEIWIDGQLAASLTGPNLVSTNDLPPRIGDNPGAAGRFWVGEVDDVAIWKVALTPEEIELLWNDGNGTSVGEIVSGTSSFFRITEIQYDPGTKQVELTWASRSGRTYAVYASTSPSDLGLEITDGVEAAGDSTSYEFANPFPDADSVFYRVVELP